MLRQKIIQYHDELMRYARRLSRNRENAEDLVQDTMMRALVYEHTFSGDDTALRSWMYTILRNLYMGQYRRERVRARAIPYLQGNYPFVENNGEVMLTFQAVCERAVVVNRRQLYALLRVTIDGLSYDEVALEEHVPVGIIRSRIARARAALANAIA